MLTVEEKDHISRALFTAMDTRDFSYIEQHMDEGLIFDFPGIGIVEGRKRVLTFMKAMLRKYSSLSFTISRCIQQDDHSCVVWTNQGNLNSGEPYRNSGITLVRFAEEQIVFISDYFKDTSFTQPA
jgi:ketosteroid isomerase-like protein